MERFILFILAVVVIFSILSYLVNRFTPKKKYIKYLLPLITLILAVYNFYLAKIPSEGFKGLGYLMMSFIFFAGFLSSLLSGLFFDLILPRLKRKN